MFVKPGFSNHLTFVYSMPIFKELRHLCKFELRISVFKRYMPSTTRQRTSTIDIAQSQSIGSPRLDISRVDVNTELLGNHRITIKLTECSYLIEISSSQNYTIKKKTATDTQVVQSFFDKNPHFQTKLFLRFDVLSKRIQF